MEEANKFWMCECGESHKITVHICDACKTSDGDGEAITDDIDIRKATLADHLDMDFSDIDDASYGDNRFEAGGDEYYVLTDDEADDLVKEKILDSVWAFNASFIIDNTELPYEAKEMISSFQADKCEGANDTILAMIKDKDAFCEAAVSADGRGHFLSGYDGNETEHEGYYIYRD